MPSPRDWIERLRRRPRLTGPDAAPASAARPASLPDVFGIPADVREVLLELERRGHLRKALEMRPDRALLASHLAELVAVHGPVAFREALEIIDLRDGSTAARVTATPPSAAKGAASAPAATEPQRSAAVAAPAEASLAPDVIAQLGNLNVNQWRGDSRNTDGWYVPGRDGRRELFVVRSAVSPRLFKELTGRGLIRREVEGVAASSAMTFTVQAGKYPYKGVIALDVEKLKVDTGTSFDGIHSRWDGAARKYPVTVMRGEEVKHEPVT